MTASPRPDIWALTAAVAVTGAGILIGTDLVHIGLSAVELPSPGPQQFAVAAAVAAIAQFAMVWVRVGTGTIGLAWGEAAIVILCALLPPAWVPLAVLIGVGSARIVRAIHEQSVGTALVSTSNLTIAGAVAAVASNIIAIPSAEPFSPRVAAALCLGAAAYALTGGSLVSWRLARRHKESFWTVSWRAHTTKLPMVAGNMVVGLIAVSLVDVHSRWLIGLPPALWLLHQAYAARLRSDDERRTWQVFAEATSELNKLNERGAASAGIKGALRLFGARAAQVSVTAPDGAVRGYAGERDAEIVECEPSDSDGPGATSRGLFVGGVRVGELRLTMPKRLRRRDRLMFAAYADALAAALHDAATHQELRAMTARSTWDMIHDPLTGLANRAGFLAQGDTTLRELPADRPVGLLLIDVDHFKEVNDTLGHAAGDELLRVTAGRLDTALNSGGLLARLGGDEFAVLLPKLPEPTQFPPELRAAEYPGQLAFALGRARALAGSLATPSEVAGVQLSVEASIGAVVAPAGAVDLTELLRRADIAMYQAKRGRSSVAWYDPSRDQASTDRLSLLAEMREALTAGDQLTLLMQPAVGLSDGAATGVEALVRWQHPRRGTLVPADFVTVVEHSELLGQFTRHILDRALEIAAGWAAEGIDVPVAVNLSPRSLLDPRLPDDVAALLARHGAGPDRLVLEITETVVMSELPVIEEVLNRLRELGVRLAVDDFGTGYSSLTFLTRVPVDEVKVDRTFVRRMVDSPEVAAIVRTTIDLARRLNLRVVAEGVETAEQRAALTALGCTAAQGFHFYPPMAPERVTRVLHEIGAASAADAADAASAATMLRLRAEETA